MILTDGTHVISDSSDDELHDFAQRIGLKKAWFQFIFRHPHYDLTTKRMVDKAIIAGAKKVTTRELLERLRKK